MEENNLHITIRDGKQMQIEMGSEIAIRCISTGFNGSEQRVKIDGFCFLDGSIIFNSELKIISIKKGQAGKFIQAGEETFITGRVVNFRGIKPIVQISGFIKDVEGSENPEITLNNINDIINIIQP